MRHHPLKTFNVVVLFANPNPFVILAGFVVCSYKNSLFTRTKGLSYGQFLPSGLSYQFILNSERVTYSRLVINLQNKKKIHFIYIMFEPS